MQPTSILSRTKKYVLTITATLILSFTATAQVYKSVDADGKVTFTDQPDAQAEAVDIKTPNTLPAVTNKTAPPTEREIVTGYTSVAISSPADNSIIANGLLPFTVTAATQPALKKTHKLQLKIDGEVHSTSTGSFAIDGMYRGEHHFQVEILDKNNQPIKQSAPIKVFVYRPGK